MLNYSVFCYNYPKCYTFPLIYKKLEFVILLKECTLYNVIGIM